MYDITEQEVIWYAPFSSVPQRQIIYHVKYNGEVVASFNYKFQANDYIIKKQTTNGKQL